ncbi:unnamed protein product, partial [Polarella glacialis]
AIKPENLTLESAGGGRSSDRDDGDDDDDDDENFMMDIDVGSESTQAAGAPGGNSKYAKCDPNELAAAMLQAELCGDDEELASLNAELAARQAAGGSAGRIGTGGGGAPRGGPSITERVEVPFEVVGSIIGAGGESIKWLSAESGARLTFEQEEDQEPGVISLSRICLVRGPAEAVAKAKQLLQDAIGDAMAERQDRGRRDKGGKGKGKGKDKGQRKGTPANSKSDEVGGGAAGDEAGICK